MRDLTLTIPQGFYKRKTKAWSSSLQLNLMLLVCTIVMVLGYLFMVNALGTKGYEIRKLEQEVRLLESDQKKMQVETSDLQSINRIQLYAQKLNYVPATNVTYLKDSDFALK